MTAGAYSNEMDAKYWLVIALVQFQQLSWGIILTLPTLW